VATKWLSLKGKNDGYGAKLRAWIELSKWCDLGFKPQAKKGWWVDEISTRSNWQTQERENNDARSQGYPR